MKKFLKEAVKKLGPIVLVWIADYGREEAVRLARKKMKKHGLI